MIDIKEFVAKGYSINELPNDLIVIHKVVKDKVGVKYKIRILLDKDGFDPEVEYNSKPVSYLRLETDEKTTLDEIEGTFEETWVVLGGKYF
jgi:hypothetical protein